MAEVAKLWMPITSWGYYLFLWGFHTLSHCRRGFTPVPLQLGLHAGRTVCRISLSTTGCGPRVDIADHSVIRERRHSISNQMSNFIGDNFEKLQTIGRGGFGEVYLYHVRHKIEHEIYAINMVKLNDTNDNCKRQKILKEVQNLKTLLSEYVVNYHNSWLEANHLFIQMDYYKQNLQTIIANKHIVFGRQPEEPMKVYEYFISCEIFKELLECVKYLHDSCSPVIHRDLKPSNVLISQNSKNSRFVKLCDFGSATFHDKTSMSHYKNVGTSRYIAQEVNNSRYTIKVDIYSLGIIAFDLFNIKA
ncbi:unnamed protein product [Medioppia subpectinata]|uniref:Protein kinase domain-containing protein n=1 Tax=Medioppia subpectinata TaxID=1979941 RepID=A0A7R9PZ03_9ACAR|nr:unnamed protein product [Medioppia subpectinata]CAG2105701.1 unnamed protein product [Medioppia subpectinata]